MTSKTLWNGSVAILAMIALVQGARLWQATRPVIPEGPTLGEPLPDLGMVSVNGGPPRPYLSAASARGRCKLIVGIAPTCAVCREMRNSWPAQFERWHDSVTASMDVEWVAAADSITMAEFYQGFALEGVAKIRLLSTGVRMKEDLGVYATPTVYLVDAAKRLRVGNIGLIFPSADSANSACGAAQ